MAERLTPHLRRLCLRLPLQDRLALCQSLRASIEQPAMAGTRERMDYLADRMRDLCGVDVREDRSRSDQAFWARAVFCLVAFQEGYPQTSIGRIVGRDHSSVSFAVSRMKDAFAMPDVYKRELQFYNKYIETL